MILVIPDTHLVGSECRKGAIPRRIEWLCDAVLCSTDITSVVCLGDWLDLPSMSRHESAAEIAASRERLHKCLALSRRCLRVVGKTTAWQRCEGRRLFVPGNHEERLMRFYRENPHAAPSMRPADYLYRASGIAEGFQVQPHALHDGWYFRHYMPSKGGGTAIGGRYAAKRILDEYPGANICVGHSHQLQVTTKTDVNGTYRVAVVAGCLLDALPPYLHGVAPDWWRGVLLLGGLSSSTPTSVMALPYSAPA